MFPEISRRCLACGASVRAGARYCPQCGTSFGAEAPPQESAPPPPHEPMPREQAAPARQTSAPAAERAPAVTPAPTPPPVPTPVEPPPAAEAAADGAGAGRTTRAAARVRETVLPRVEKMRDEALVVLEETPDDSGLRFVVIAVALFGLFLLLLLLSTTVLR